MFWNENRFTEMKCGMMEEHGWRNGHEEKPNEKLRNALPFVMERQVPSIYSVQQLWMSRFRKAQYNH